ncbi:MAG: ribonuclease H-like domain-containing protein [Ilumatobacteraceae bacterium]
MCPPWRSASLRFHSRTTATCSSTTGAILLVGGARPVLPVRHVPARRRRSLAVRGPLGARQGRRGRQTAALIEFFGRACGTGHARVHYSHTERSALQRLAKDHVVGEAVLAELVETGLFVDLYPVVRHALVVGAESYGLKRRTTRGLRAIARHIDRGAGAVLEYERYSADGDEARLARIARYNDDDVRATKARATETLRQRPAGLPWRAAARWKQRSRPVDIEDAATQLLERFPDERSRGCSA